MFDIMLLAELLDEQGGPAGVLTISATQTWSSELGCQGMDIFVFNQLSRNIFTRTIFSN